MALIDDRTVTIHTKQASQFQAPRRSLTPTLSTRRRVELDMEGFRRYSVHNDKPSPMYLKQLQLRQEDRKFSASVRVTNTAPPTPPLEQIPVVVVKSSNHENENNFSASNISSHEGVQAETVLLTPQAQLPSDSITSDLSLAGIARLVAQSIDRDSMPSSVKIISQVMPSCGTDARPVKMYETLCEHLQIEAPHARYISIHHPLALSDGQSVQDLPRSPPVTPGLAGRGGYFDDPSIFTHFAQVPVHHGTRFVTSPRSPPQRLIMPPEANFVVLERYIPPTSPEEASDFFDANSCRSYAADRMLELSDSKGSMVLIYPTKSGAKTFSQKYVGPILEPILMELVVLRGLATTAAASLGRMSAVEELVEFDEMKTKVGQLCSKLNERHDIRNSRSAFTLLHSQVCNVNLSRDTWLNWFIDQEFPRLKQDLIEYRADGGRLPQSASGVSEASEAALAREITCSLLKTSKPEPSEPIEVGVFVIKRARTS